MTVSTENFLKTVYKLSRQPNNDTRLGTIARLLNITNAAATDMARKLAVKELVDYTKYKPLTLTTSGTQLALNVIRKHRLWEAFLHKTFNLNLHEIHREAEHLEHLTSDFLAEKIEKYLGYPTTDPHGDPIPALNGERKADNSQVLLSMATAGYTYEVSRLSSSEKDFFEFCNANHLIIGSTLKVEKQYDSNKMTEIKIDQNKILLNKEFTDIIYVRQLENR
ncbi:metal-dependent transcriptional regulator [Sunxiuqinia sp. A32]|uniref:metal-dependent transcriptional regulator n=1 Tax=Sunxiuqinia sp. A32 TaxID=3461496 RepID=UPI0040458FFE